MRHLNVERFRVKPATRLNLDTYDPADTAPFESATHARKMLTASVKRLYELTELLYAQNRWSVLFVFQAMDGAGKDSAIKHVMRGLDPKSTQVFSFAVPSAEELRHDFMWRCLKNLPERGRIGVFNRSYYEEVLVVKVHPEFLHAQRLPESDVSTPKFWEHRYKSINNFERHLARNGTRIVKFFLNVSKEEQKRRFVERLDDPKKHWKFSPSDVSKRAHWDDYMQAYEDMLRATATKWAPWYVIPADHKWAARAAVAAILTNEIKRLDLKYPEPSDQVKASLEESRKKLEAEE